MMATFISSTGTSHLMDASRGVTPCGRKYFTPEARSAFNLVTCRRCAVIEAARACADFVDMAPIGDVLGRLSKLIGAVTALEALERKAAAK